MNIHLYQGQCQITLEEIRVGFLIMDEGIGYLEWLKCGVDIRGRRKWKNMLYPGIWNRVYGVKPEQKPPDPPPPSSNMEVA